MGFIERLEKLKIDLMKNCERCNHTGFIDDKVCDCTMEFRVINRLLPRGFPEEYLLLNAHEILKNIKVSEKDKKILNWYIANFQKVKEQGLSLYIWSDKVGVGKTSLAILIAKEFARWNLQDENYVFDFDAYYLDIFSFCELIKKNDIEIEDTMKCKFLVLDEFGREGLFEDVKDWITRNLERWLRYRIANRLPNLLVSNLSPDRIFSVYGERLTSLLGFTNKEINGLVFREIQLRGSDLRRGWLKSRWED